MTQQFFDNHTQEFFKGKKAITLRKLKSLARSIQEGEAIEITEKLEPHYFNVKASEHRRIHHVHRDAIDLAPEQ